MITLAIPAIGYGVSLLILHDMNKDLAAEGVPKVTMVCNAVRTGELGGEATAQMTGYCRELANLELLG